MESKWSDREDLKMSSTTIDVPDNHILVIGQMPGDETVCKQSFGSHWDKLILIVRKLYKQYPLVIKIHPTLQSEAEKSGTWLQYKETIDEWKNLGITVVEGRESIHGILPKTKVAIIENSTAGIECMMHDVPIISYGYPEYHWITKDLRHLPQLTNAINDLSWWSKEKNRKFLSWYCEQYLCYDQESTTRRIKWLIEYC
jgi:CDP-glycerol glycerophosphotransferase (TagB/SpsB family)